jgi:hypothetical protein
MGRLLEDGHGETVDALLEQGRLFPFPSGAPAGRARDTWLLFETWFPAKKGRSGVSRAVKAALGTPAEHPSALARQVALAVDALPGASMATLLTRLPTGVTEARLPTGGTEGGPAVWACLFDALARSGQAGGIDWALARKDLALAAWHTSVEAAAFDTTAFLLCRGLRQICPSSEHALSNSF